MKLVRTRHQPQLLHEYKQNKNHPNGNDYIPGGVDLERPFPEARVLFVDYENGWVFVWWIDTRLMRAEGESNDSG